MNPPAATVDLKTVDNILKVAVEAVKRSREQIYDIAESARSECAALEQELLQVQEAVAREIERVEHLERADRAARDRLIAVGRTYQERSYAEIQAAHEQARRVHADLQVARERELHLRRRRDDLARRIRNMQSIAERAEDLVSRVGVVMDYLESDLERLTTTVNDFQRQQEVGFSITRAQEEERRRVAREMHDGPAQVLAAVVLKLDLCQRLLDGEPHRLRSELRGIADAARLGLQEVRTIIFNLRPMALDELGLVAALRSYLAAYREHTGVDVELRIDGQEELRLPAALEIAAYRLVQEALANVAKHSGAGAAEVHLELRPEGIAGSVRDAGCGFEVEPVWKGERDGAFGITGMRERVQMLRGTLRVQSAPGQGTAVLWYLPVAGEEGDGGPQGTGG
jgi:two-component system sensor histidine kinase DegS